MIQKDFCEKLYEEKGHSKFLLQSLVELEKKQNKMDDAKIKKYLQTLIEIDPIRVNYYKFLMIS